ncbi:MAG TPA: acyltransferase domain-containing protein, partial [Pirellulales bacterium]
MAASAQLGPMGIANEIAASTARAAAARQAASAAGIDLAWPSEVVVVRGEDRADLICSIDALLLQISRQPNLRLVDVAFTLNKALLPEGARLAIVATDLSDLARRLALAKESLADPNTKRLRDPSGAYFETEPLSKRGDVALLFPGEGTQYLGMLDDLPAHYPEVSERLALFDGYVGPDGEDHDSVSRFFAPPASFSENRKSHLERRLRQLDNALFAVLAADWAVLSFLQELQLNVAAVAGHSAGELAALVAAGSIDVSTHNQSIIEGMRALGDAEDHSQPAEATLLATSASRETLEKAIGGIAGAIATGPDQNIFVAMDNCPHQSVVVGLSAPVEKLEAALKRDRVVCERLPFSRPYHTPLFAPFMGPLTEMFDTVDFLSPQTRIYSCTTGRPFPNDAEAIRQGAMSHWTSPVEFRRMIQNMHADGVRIFIEAGPRGVLSAFVQDILRGQEFVALPVDLPRRSALTQINHLLAQLAVHQAQFNFDLLYRRRVEQVELGETKPGSLA